MDTQIPIDNQTASIVEFCSFDLLGVLAMDYFSKATINCSKSLHQTYKSLSHRFCSPTNGSLLSNIQLILGILHRWNSFFSSRQHGTSPSPEEFDKPCLLSFSKWSKAIENGELE